MPFYCTAETCIDWFNKSKISRSDKSCISLCTVLKVDMGTFSCAEKCEKFCNAKCKHDSYWQKKIIDGRPQNWEPPTEKSLNWTNEEKEKILTVLDRLPSLFKEKSFNTEMKKVTFVAENRIVSIKSMYFNLVELN